MGTYGRRSSGGSIAAFLLGGVLGLAVGYPALPAVAGFGTDLGASQPGTVGTVLLVGALAVLVIPFVMLALYQVFALVDR